MCDKDNHSLEFKDMYKHKMDLIQKAIDDTQNTIRFTDTKAAAVIGFWGIVFTILFRTTDSWSSWISAFTFSVYNIVILAILVMMLFYFIKSVCLAYLVLVPKTNPVKHVKTEDVSINELYFISSLDKPLSGRSLYRLSENIKLKDSTNTYYEKIQGLDHDGLMRELIIELQKVSFIRTVKVARANISITSVINFLITLFLLFVYIIGNQFMSGSYNIMFNLNLNIELLAVLLIGHLIGDYLLQTNKQALKKTEEWIPLILHCVVYTVTLSILAYFLDGLFNWTMSFIIFITHIFIDRGQFVKWWAKRIKGIKDLDQSPIRSVLMAIDQTFHIIVIFAICYLN